MIETVTTPTTGDFLEKHQSEKTMIATTLESAEAHLVSALKKIDH